MLVFLKVLRTYYMNNPYGHPKRTFDSEKADSKEGAEQFLGIKNFIFRCLNISV